MYSQHVCQHYVCLFIYSISIIQSPEFTVGWVWWREKNGWPRRRYLSNKSVITIFMIWIFGNFDLIHNKQWNEESVGFGRQHARTLKVGPWPMGRLSLLRGMGHEGNGSWTMGERRAWAVKRGITSTSLMWCWIHSSCVHYCSLDLGIAPKHLLLIKVLNSRL